MTTELRQVYEQIRKGKIFPFYYLYGKERFLVDELLSMLQKRIGGGSDFNHNIFYAGEDSVSDIVDALNTAPMMSERRLIEVRGIDNYAAKDLNALLPIIEEPSPMSVIIFLAEEIDRRSRFVKALSSSGLIIECRHPYDDQVAQWVHYMGRKIKKRVDEKAIPFLISTVGNRLQNVYNELLKAAAYVGDKECIVLEDIQSVVSPLREVTVFDFTKAVAKRDTKRAIRLLGDLLRLGEPEPVILTMLVRQWRLLLRGKLLLRKGTPPQVVGDTLKIHRYFQRDFFDQCARHQSSDLRSGFTLLHDADLRIKRSNEDKKMVLEGLTLKLCCGFQS